MKFACRLLNALIAILLLFALVLTPQPAAAGDLIPELFGPSLDADAAPATQPAALALRSRTASFNPAQLDAVQTALARRQDPGPLALTLFAGSRVVARFERVERTADGGVTLSGKISGSPFGEIHVAQVGSATYASINTYDSSFEFHSTDGINVQIVEIENKQHPIELDAISPTQSNDALSPGVPSAVVNSSTVDDGSRIDVLVAYTTATKIQRGGTNASILAYINLAMAESNQGYINSGINQRVSLAGTVEINFDEAHSPLANNDATWWISTLHKFSNPADPTFGPVHTMRNLVAADEVVLLLSNSYENTCGLAWLMTNVSTSFQSNAFAMVAGIPGCATGYYSFAHELGHNMGAHHDKVTAGSAQGAYPYSYGYWILNPVSSHYDYRTVMAYDVPSSYGYSSFRINYWSNPSISYNGLPVGSSEANNALTLNNTALTVAQFRDGAVPLAPASLTASAQGAATQLSWTFSGSDVRKFRVERASFGQTNWTEIAQTPANVLTYTDETAAANQIYTYRVLSDNGNGRTASNDASNLNPPTGLMVSHTGTQYQLTWTDNASNESGYEVQWAPGGCDVWTVIPVVQANTFTDNPGAGEFCYRVRAVGTAGAVTVFSFFSNLGYTLPNSPTDLSAVPINQARIRLSWTDTSLIESGFPIVVSVEGSAWNTITTAPPSTGNPTNFEVFNLVCNTLYDFRVQAQSGPNAYSLEYAGPAPVTTLVCVAPDKPGSATAVAIDPFSILLSWSDVDGETGFRVEEINDQRTWSLANNVTSYRVNGLKPDTRYDFRVVAVNSTAAPGNQDSSPAEVSGSTKSAIFMPRVTR